MRKELNISFHNTITYRIPVYFIIAVAIWCTSGCNQNRNKHLPQVTSELILYNFTPEVETALKTAVLNQKTECTEVFSYFEKDGQGGYQITVDSRNICKVKLRNPQIQTISSRTHRFIQLPDDLLIRVIFDIDKTFAFPTLPSDFKVGGGHTVHIDYEGNLIGSYIGF